MTEHAMGIYCAMFAHTHQNTVVLFFGGFFGTASVTYIFLHLGGTITSSFRLQKKMSKMIWPHRTILIYTSLCRAGLKLFPGLYCQLKCIPLSIYLSISVHISSFNLRIVSPKLICVDTTGIERIFDFGQS